MGCCLISKFEFYDETGGEEDFGSGRNGWSVCFSAS